MYRNDAYYFLFLPFSSVKLFGMKHGHLTSKFLNPTLKLIISFTWFLPPPPPPPLIRNNLFVFLQPFLLLLFSAPGQIIHRVTLPECCSEEEKLKAWLVQVTDQSTDLWEVIALFVKVYVFTSSHGEKNPKLWGPARPFAVRPLEFPGTRGFSSSPRVHLGADCVFASSPCIPALRPLKRDVRHLICPTLIFPPLGFVWGLFPSPHFLSLFPQMLSLLCPFSFLSGV